METFFCIGQGGFREYLEERMLNAGFIAVDLEDADIILSYFINGDEMEDRYYGDDGIFKKAKKDCLILEFSPSTLDLSREIFAIAQSGGLHFVECPMVVEDCFVCDAFTPRNLSCFVGGEKADVKTALPILSLIVGKCNETGLTGTAVVAKVARTIQHASLLFSAFETKALYDAAKQAPLAMEVEFGAPYTINSDIAEIIEKGETEDYSGTYTIEMLCSEMYSAESMAQDNSLYLPTLNVLNRFLGVLMLAGGADMGVSALTLLFVNEEQSAKYGLDWSRVKMFMKEEESDDWDDDCCCHDDFDFDEDDDFGEDDEDEDDEDGDDEGEDDLEDDENSDGGQTDGGQTDEK